MAAISRTPSINIVQYILVRGDLLHVMKWPTGAVIAQACHACTAVMHLYRHDENVVQFASDLDNMHKVVLEAKNENDLRTLSVELTRCNIDHKLWIEQPEDCATCIAVKPYPKKDVQKHFKNFKLFK